MTVPSGNEKRGFTARGRLSLWVGVVCVLVFRSTNAHAILTNAGIEFGASGQPVGWTQFGGIGSFQTGNNFGITPNQGDGYWDDVTSFTGANRDGGILQVMATKPGVTYTVTVAGQAHNSSAFAYINGAPPQFPNDTQVRIGVDLTGSNNQNGGSVAYTPYISTGAQFQDITTSFTATGASTTLFLRARSDFAFAGNWLAFDNIRIRANSAAADPTGLFVRDSFPTSGAGAYTIGDLRDQSATAPGVIGFVAEQAGVTRGPREWHNDTGDLDIQANGLTHARALNPIGGSVLFNKNSATDSFRKEQRELAPSSVVISNTAFGEFWSSGLLSMDPTGSDASNNRLMFVIGGESRGDKSNPIVNAVLAFGIEDNVAAFAPGGTNKGNNDDGDPASLQRLLNAAGAPVNVRDNQTHMFIVKLLRNVDGAGNDQVRVWMDATDTNTEGLLDATALAKGTFFGNFWQDFGIPTIALEGYKARGTFDEFLIGRALSDVAVVQVPEPTMAALGLLAAAGLAKRRRRAA